MYPGERLNSITHLLGVFFSVAATSVLVTMATLKGDVTNIVGMSIYGSMTTLLYTASTLYHSIRGPWKRVLQQLDHVSIYLMIAGTYTPFMVVMNDSFSWILLLVVWLLALIGILQEIIIGPKTRRYSLFIYAVMAGLTIFDTQALIQKLSMNGFRWILAGGLIYTIGMVVYVLDQKIKHGHGIWHLLVLAGSGCHFACLVGYVINV